MARVAVAVALLAGTAAWAGSPPAQHLPSALLAFPYVESNGYQDTRIELVNLSGETQVVNCFYVYAGVDLCTEVGFFLSLTPYQPAAWLASAGFSNPMTGSLVPPFFGQGELKCVVVPSREPIAAHNAIQGRATVFSGDGQTVAYNAVGFRRLRDGQFTGVVSLDGSTYAQCPDKLHFQVLADTDLSRSDLILVPCSQDLLTQTFSTVTTQFVVYNEFEQQFSTSISVTCFSRRTLTDIASFFDRSQLGTATAHVVLRGSGGPLLGLVVDSVPYAGSVGITGNEPSFQGGRSATVTFPSTD